MTTTPNEIPSTPQGIAGWLMGRHPWLRQVLARIEEHPEVADAWRRDVEAATAALLPAPIGDVPQAGAEAAAWLLVRHPWAAALVGRVVDVDERGAWLGRLADVVSEGQEHAQDWARRLKYNPPPVEAGDMDFWMEAVDEPSDAVMPYVVLPVEDQQVLRLLVTLHPRDEAGESAQVSWNVADVPAGARSAALVNDWLMIVRQQQTETTEASR